MKVLVTGAAGFIGMHVSRLLLQRGHQVLGIDNLNSYYEPSLKESRLKLLEKHPQFNFEKIDLVEGERLQGLFQREKFDKVIHLAAQAGVRYGLKDPLAYINSNIHGFLSILECCRHFPVKHLVFASSSSVYGKNTQMPYSESHNVSHPISLYAATKISNEVMAHSYAHLFQIPITGLRFFTVYGPWGRPDMAPFLFAKAILEGRALEVFNNGDMYRDFTFIDDIAEGVLRILDVAPRPDEQFDTAKPDPSRSDVPFRIYNIGNNNPVKLMDFITALEEALQKKAELKFMPVQAGDVISTFADTEALAQATKFRPRTTIRDGVQLFVDWFKEYYGC